MPPLRPKEPVCKACGGTGVSSKGGPCEPCEVNKIRERHEEGLKRGFVPVDYSLYPPDIPKSAKADYVRSQSRDHHCHWPGSGSQCPPAQWSCKKHWFMLPKWLRDKVWTAYRPGQEVTMTPSREYLKVADEVHRWIGENHPAKVKDIFDD